MLRQDFEKNFFTDKARFETAERIISVMKTAGDAIDYGDYLALISPIYGDLAAARYVYAAIKQSGSSVRIGAIKELIGTTAELFRDCYYDIHKMHALKYTPHIETKLIVAAEKSGIDMYYVDHSKPAYSPNRIERITGIVDTDELIKEATNIAGVKI